MKSLIYALSISSLLCISAVAQAGQHPNADQRATLEIALTEAGYVSWGEIELDDGYWEIDDARKETGALEKYDVIVDPDTMKVVREKLDD